MALSGGFSRGRRLFGATEGVLGSLAVLGLVAATVYAATRPTLRARLDLTEGDHYTLSSQTVSVLRALEQPVEVVQLLRAESQLVPNGLFEVQQRAIDYVDSMLREYAIASGGKLRVRRLDPVADRLEAENLARRLHLTRYNVVVVRGAERVRQVFLEEMVTIDRGLADPSRIEPAELVDLRGEAPLTSALLSVAAATDPRIGFLQAVGGPSLEGDGGFGLGLYAESLRGQGLAPAGFTLHDEEGVPEDLAVAVVWGPDVRIGPRAAEALGAFHAEGGSLLLGIDPALDDPDLDALLAGLGLRRERAVLTNDQGPHEGERRTLLALNRFDPGHEITAPIARQGYFAMAAGLGGLERLPGAPPALVARPLLLTDPGVFGDHFAPGGEGLDHTLGDAEQRAARAVAYAVEGEGRGRAVVFAGSSFLLDPFLTSAEGGRANLDLGLHAANWLTGREHAIAERPVQVFESRVDLLESERRQVVLYVLGLMPLGGAALGLLVWFARRR